MEISLVSIPYFTWKILLVRQQQKWVLTIRDVDTRRDAAVSKGKDIEASKVRLQEAILLEGASPRQLKQQLLGRVHQLREGFGARSIHHGDPATELSPLSGRVSVRLYESYVPGILFERDYKQASVIVHGLLSKCVCIQKQMLASATDSRDNYEIEQMRLSQRIGRFTVSLYHT